MECPEEALVDRAVEGWVRDFCDLLSSNPDIDVNFRESRIGSQTALIVGNRGGHDTVVSALLAHPRIDVNVRDVLGRTALLAACASGRLGCAKLLLQDLRVDPNLVDEGGSSALWLACWRGHVDLVRLFIASGREIDVERASALPDGRKCSPIEFARLHHFYEVVALLEGLQANPVTARQFARRELVADGVIEADFAARVPAEVSWEEYVATLQKLSRHWDMRAAFYQACAADNVRSLFEVLKAEPSIDVNAQQMGDFTALSVACKEGKTAAVQLLLAHPRIAVNARDIDGGTAMMGSPSPAVSQLLRDLRVDINRPDYSNRTPVWHAANDRDLRVLKFMIASGRDLDLDRRVVGEKGGTFSAVEKADDNGSHEVVALLNRFQTDPVQTRALVRRELAMDGILPDDLEPGPPPPTTWPQFLLRAEEILAARERQRQLFVACGGRRLAEVEQLLHDHPDLDVNALFSEDNGFTTSCALHAACDRCDAAILSALLAHPRVNVNVQNAEGKTALHRSTVVSTTRLLLRDPRIDINLADVFYRTPLWVYCYAGNAELVEWVIATGRYLDLEKAGQEGNSDLLFTPLEVAILRDYRGVSDLLSRFRECRERVRHKIRLDLALNKELSAELYAAIVFLCDGLLHAKVSKGNPAVRFFSIARRLPLELQRIVCNRTYEVADDHIPLPAAERAFRYLAEAFTIRQVSHMP